MRFCKKTAVVNAAQWDGSADTANAVLGERYGVDWQYASRESDELRGNPNDDTEFRVTVGSWIVKDEDGCFSSCKPDVFDLTYEPVGKNR
jgi:hypothetical protein